LAASQTAAQVADPAWLDSWIGHPRWVEVKGKEKESGGKRRG